MGNYLLLLLYLGRTSSHRSIPYGYLLYPLGQGHQDYYLCFLRVCSWRIRQSRRHWIRRYRNSWFIDTLIALFEHVHEIYLFLWWFFFLVRTVLMVLELLCSSAVLFCFLNYQTPDKGIFLCYEIGMPLYRNVHLVVFFPPAPNSNTIMKHFVITWQKLSLWVFIIPYWNALTVALLWDVLAWCVFL
jgi:hypothetical protein